MQLSAYLCWEAEGPSWRGTPRSSAADVQTPGWPASCPRTGHTWLTAACGPWRKKNRQKTRQGWAKIEGTERNSQYTDFRVLYSLQYSKTSILKLSLVSTVRDDNSELHYKIFPQCEDTAKTQEWEQRSSLHSCTAITSQHRCTIFRDVLKPRLSYLSISSTERPLWEIPRTRIFAHTHFNGVHKAKK